MSFSSAFDPVRALGESWRLVARAPVPLLLAGSGLVLLSADGVEERFERSQSLRIDGWESAFEHLFATAFTAVACVVGILAFLAACFLTVTLARTVERTAHEGRAELSDVLSAGGRFVPMLVTQVLCGLGLILLGAPLLLVVWVGVAAAPHGGDVFGAVALLLAVAWIPLFVYVYLGLRLAEPAIALEGLEPVAAIRRSWELVRGNRWRLLFYLLVTALFEWLGVFLCCVGVLLTGTMKRVAVNESYLRLVRSEEERAGWWLENPFDAAEPPAS